jgi:hypothetical protein
MNAIVKSLISSSIKRFLLQLFKAIMQWAKRSIIAALIVNIVIYLAKLIKRLLGQR